MIEDEIEWFRFCLHECAHSKVAHSFGIDTVRIQVRGGLRGGGYAQFDNFSNPIAALAVVMAGGIIEELALAAPKDAMATRSRSPSTSASWVGTKTIRASRCFAGWCGGRSRRI